MPTYPSIPTPGRRPPIPSAYDPKVRLPPLDAVVQFLGNQSFTTYLIESAPQDSDLWELRPGWEHRGGKAWLRSPDRIVNVSGVWAGSALAFRTERTAVECASFLSRADRRTRYRVVPVATSVVCGEPVEV